MHYKIVLCIFLVFIFPLSATNVIVQNFISGQVISKTDSKAISYVTITFKNDSTKFLQRVSSDVDGRFSFTVNSSGIYRLILSATGFQQLEMPVQITEPKTDLGKLLLKEGVFMNAITVTALKPLVKVDVDKITYSVESDPDAQTCNGLEILRKVPLLAVDAEENVTMNGQSNFKVLVNGKSSSMMSKNFREVIKSLPANTIKDIEVITNPSTKYEAEGVGGIINIITVRKTINGYNGSFSTGFDSWGSMNASTYLSAKSNKFGFSGRYSINQQQRPPRESSSSSENFNSEIFHFTNSKNVSKDWGFAQQFSGEASYDIDTFNLISASFLGYWGNGDNESNSENRVLNTSNEISKAFNNRNYGSFAFGNLSGNIDYQKSFKKPDKSFTVSYKIDTDPRIANQYSRIDSILDYESYKQRTKSSDIGQEHSVQLDYYNPLTKRHQYECGLKFIYRNNENISERWRDEVLRTDFSNALSYDQYIFGTYVGYVFKFKKLTAKSGFRMERTWNYGLSKSDDTVRFTNKLFNIVPYISFAYQLRPGYTIKASYTQRLQRPGVNYLNPYVNNSNPLYISYGNPLLKSEVSHSFELGYSMFNKGFSWNTSLNASLNNNAIENVTTLDSIGIATTTFKNIGLAQRFIWNNYLSYRLGSKFNANGSFSANYARYAANNGLELSNSGISFRGNFGIRASLWKDASISGDLGYSSPNIYLQGRQPANAYSSVGFNQYFLKRKMSLNISVADPLTEKRNMEGYQKGIGYATYYAYFYYTRTARVSLSYNFGKLDVAVKKARRGITNDDRKSGSSE